METETETELQAPPIQKRPPTWLRYLNGCLQVIVALLMARGALWLYTRNNDFPVDYHPDEFSKAAQIADPNQDRNFNHPLLLVEAANWSRQYFKIPLESDQRDLVFIGRWTSALMSAIGVFAIALAGAIAYGWAGLLICGTVMMLCPPLLVHAHYFKEDTSLVFGIMVAILGARLLMSAKLDLTQVLAAAFMGLGAGLAVSGKLVGAAVVAPCLVALLIARFHGWLALPLRIVAFLAVAYGTFVYINYRVFLDWTTLQVIPMAADKIETEYGHGTIGHASGISIGMNTPNIYCLSVAAEDMMPHLWAFIAVGAIWWLFHRQKISRWGIVVIAFFVTFAAALSKCAIPFGRYALPVTITLFVLAAAMISRVVYDLMRTRPLVGTIALAICLLFIGMVQYKHCTFFNNEFGNDGRQRMREWIAENVPAGTTVVADRYTSLAGEGDRWRFPTQKDMNAQIRNSFYAGNLGATPRDMANSGVDYVAIAEASYGRFFARTSHGLDSYKEQVEQLKSFYEELEAHPELLVWSWPPAGSPQSHSYVGQPLRIYKIAKLRP